MPETLHAREWTSFGTRAASSRSDKMKITSDEDSALLATLRASARIHFPDADEADELVARALKVAIAETEAGRAKRDRKRWLLRLMDIP